MKLSMQVKMISALEKKGIDKVWAIIEEYRKTMGELDKVINRAPILISYASC